MLNSFVHLSILSVHMMHSTCTWILFLFSLNVQNNMYASGAEKAARFEGSYPHGAHDGGVVVING
jgi:hypothetical protein